MKPTLQPGLRGEATRRVVTADLVSHYHEQGAPVLGSPFMLMLMEFAAFNAILPHLDEGEQSVGVKFNFEHLAATPPGMQVTAKAELTALDGIMATFNIECHDEHEPIGRGTHTRAIIEVDRFKKRLERKKAGGA